MEYKENNINSLLPRYCEGIATTEEQQRVKDWMQESEENSRIVKQMEMLYLATDTVNIMKKVNTDRAFVNLKGRMVNKRKVSWLGWAQRAAAVLFLPLLTAFLIKYYTEKDVVVQMLDVKTNPGMTTTIVLPDSTIVYLNSESSLRYPSSFEGSKQRRVELKGEAYFEVRKSAEKHFIVNIPHQSQIEVLGTSFNVEAYEDTPDISATLIEGKVKFSFQEGAQKRQIALSPRQKLIYDSSNGETYLYETSGETETSWKDGRIVFNNTSLQDALHILSKRYNVVFKQTNPKLKNAFTGTFTDQRLERILEYFKLSSNINWKYIDGNDVSQKRTHIEIY